MDKTCWFCGDFSACWCGKVGVGGGWSQLGGWTKRVGFVVTFRRVGAGKSTLKLVVSSWARAWPLGLSRWGLGRLFAATVSTVPGHRARPPARHWLRQWLCYRRCYEWLRMTLTGRVIRECRMQFPRHCVAPRFHIVGIATFVDAVESSFNRIACETAPRMCACTHVGPMARAWDQHLARGPSNLRVGGAQAHI